MLDPTAIAAGTIIGNDYEVESLLGQGNMAMVYKARQISLNRPVALKILFSTIEEEDQSFIDIFFHEVRSAALMIHPNLVHAIDAGEDHGLLYLAMEYVEGQSLRELMNTDSLPDMAKIIKIMADIALALDYGVKKHSLTHGDIKPDNIMIKTDGNAKLADFGLAQTKEDSRMTTGIFVTPLYASPEAIRGETKPGDPMPDIYSFGCTLFNLLAGQPPFLGETPEEVCNMHLTMHPPRLEDEVKGLPEDLCRLVNSTLQKDPVKRPRNWHVVAERLYGLLEGHKDYKATHKVIYIDHTVEHNKAVAEAVRRYSKPRSKSGLSLFLLLLFAILTIAGGGYLFHNREYWRSKSAFNDVKKKVKTYTKPESACTHLRNYIQHYGDNAVPEAKDLLKEYEAKLSKSSEE